ncbi:MAG TPA: hypothetical protein VG267_03620 [Terracidiphilus sp.]|jgi:hypothetical protein|nr:hypothetical protein [Terracidiphilus sp.]
MEAFLLLLVLFFLVAVLPKALLRMKLEANGMFVLAVIGFVLLVPATGAFLTYGQPIWAGMIEERRAFGYLIFFPVMLAIRSRLVSPRTVLNYVTGAAVLCVINAVLYYLTVSSLQAVESLTSETNARADRTPIGTGFILIAVCYSLSRYIETPKLRWALLWAMFIFDVVALEQGRQTILAVAVATVGLLWGKGKAFKRLVFTCLCAFAAVLPFIWASVVRVWQKYVFLFELLSHAQNLRVDTLHTVLSRNLLVPHGALWAQWNEGFSRYFGVNFFLSDIGVFGELFCYGAVLLVILLVSYYGYIFWQIRAAEWNTLTRACAATIVILIVLHAFQPVIEQGGFDVAVILAVLTSQKRDAARKLSGESHLANAAA